MGTVTQKNGLIGMVNLSTQRVCKMMRMKNIYNLIFRERSGSVVECLTGDRGVAGSNLTSVTALWSLSKTHLS